MGPKTERLLHVLGELVRLLSSAGADHWAGWMRECERRLANSDGSGVLHLLQAYGGMGSFNDLQLEGDEGRRLEQLRSEAARLGEEIRREAGL